MSDDLDEVKNLWIILNSILVLYAIILFIYGKYFKHKVVKCNIFAYTS